MTSPTYIKRNELLRKDGAAILAYTWVIPSGVGKTFDNFYLRLSERFCEACKNDIYKKALYAYEISDFPRKKYRRPPYSAEMICKYDNGKAFLSFILTDGIKKTAEMKFTDVWRNDNIVMHKKGHQIGEKRD